MAAQTDFYLTPEREGNGLYKSKGSKFLGFLFPVINEAKAEEILKAMRRDSRFRGANHFCYARIVGTERTTVRSSDDGEPSGTAGKPILHQLENADVINCQLVVVRFFGGIELGTGGLIQSYRETARLTLENTPVKRVEINHIFEVHFPAEQVYEVEKKIRELGAKILQSGFSKNAHWTIAIKPSLSDAFTEAMKGIEYLGISVIKST